MTIHICGHSGRGRFCHRCASAASMEKTLLRDATRLDGRSMPKEKADEIRAEIARLRSVDGKPAACAPPHLPPNIPNPGVVQ